MSAVAKSPRQTPDGEPQPALKSDPKADKIEARRKAIIEVARDVFLTQGYAAASMSEIAARVGGSKGTLYNYFRSKEELFAAFMVDACQGAANAAYLHLPAADGDLRGGLIDFGELFLTFLLNDQVMAIHRLVIAEAGRFPELGRVFYENGPRKGETKLKAFFDEVASSGKLRPYDTLSLARWFRDMVFCDIYSRALWNVLGEPTPQQIRQHAVEAADIFLAAFRPE
ncbi:MAG TPA: TetR/AcrR family transcriptional regulator [Caulobacteraceae bacterium]|jgi:AcrR family transcriptional regulator|nr:TetR/AcrR family transcriptional regulator [Caulobacteraceae bacterium]